MKPREKTLIFFDDYFKGIGLDYMVFASSLLGIVREGELIPTDPEIDVCVIGDDLTEDVLKEIKTSGYFTSIYDCHEKVGEMYLSKEGPQQTGDGWVAISPLWLKNGTCYINISGDECITMNARNYDKSKWGTIEYLDRKFRCPPNPEKWLEEWYGEDWRTPKTCHWMDNSNRRKWGDI